ncbi:hypothetical protein ABW20_dc0103815 [Dactylellina cionopaga]|nr:hypothetical protein ABW20_dc0103815 [Dactylellina cionopaga]
MQQTTLSLVSQLNLLNAHVLRSLDPTKPEDHAENVAIQYENLRDIFYTSKLLSYHPWACNEVPNPTGEGALIPYIAIRKDEYEPNLIAFYKSRNPHGPHCTRTNLQFVVKFVNTPNTQQIVEVPDAFITNWRAIGTGTPEWGFVYDQSPQYFPYGSVLVTGEAAGTWKGKKARMAVLDYHHDLNGGLAGLAGSKNMNVNLDDLFRSDSEDEGYHGDPEYSNDDDDDNSSGGHGNNGNDEDDDDVVDEDSSNDYSNSDSYSDSAHSDPNNFQFGTDEEDNASESTARNSPENSEASTKSEGGENLYDRVIESPKHQPEYRPNFFPPPPSRFAQNARPQMQNRPNQNSPLQSEPSIPPAVLEEMRQRGHAMGNMMAQQIQRMAATDPSLPIFGERPPGQTGSLGQLGGQSSQERLRINPNLQPRPAGIIPSLEVEQIPFQRIAQQEVVAPNQLLSTVQSNLQAQPYTEDVDAFFSFFDNPFMLPSEDYTNVDLSFLDS